MTGRDVPTWLSLLLRGVVAAGLAVDCVIHLRLAPEYGFAFPEGMGGEVLFQVQAALAALAAVAVVASSHRAVHAFALGIAVSAVAAVVLARYTQLPAIGPLPSMYEPVWFFEKSLSAVAEGTAALAALALLVTRQRRRAGDQRNSHLPTNP